MKKDNMVKGSLRIVIVAPYPPPKAKHIYSSGVASYTKNLVEALRKINPKLEIHVISDRKKNLPKLYIDNGIVIHRTYDPGPFYVLQIFKELCRIKPNVTHLQHEYFLYGGILTAVLFPALVALSRIISNKVIVTIHGVIPLKLLNDTEFRKENGIQGPAPLLKLGLLTITKLITILTNKIIVHEPFLKEYLIRDYREKPQKITIIPHGVEELKSLPKREAKKKLGLEGKTVLLYFGYLTGYKGIKELINAYKEITKKVLSTTLIIAGGPHPRLIKEKWYRDWLHDLFKKAHAIQREIKDRGKIVFTGYVPEDEIPLYFSVADIVVLPYKTRIAASGPESLAISFEKPYIITTKIYDKYKLSREVITMLENELEEFKERLKYLKWTRKWCNIAVRYFKTYQ